MYLYLRTAREGNVFTGVCLSTIGLMGYWFTARPCYGAVGTHPTGMLSCYCIYICCMGHICCVVTLQLNIDGAVPYHHSLHQFAAWTNLLHGSNLLRYSNSLHGDLFGLKHSRGLLTTIGTNSLWTKLLYGSICCVRQFTAWSNSLHGSNLLQEINFADMVTFLHIDGAVPHHNLVHLLCSLHRQIQCVDWTFCTEHAE